MANLGEEKCVPVKENTENLLTGLFEQIDRVRRAISETEDMVMIPRPQACCDEAVTPSQQTLNDQLRSAIRATSDQATRMYEINKEVRGAIGDVKLL